MKININIDRTYQAVTFFEAKMTSAWHRQMAPQLYEAIDQIDRLDVSGVAAIYGDDNQCAIYRADESEPDIRPVPGVTIADTSFTEGDITGYADQPNDIAFVKAATKEFLIPDNFQNFVKKTLKIVHLDGTIAEISNK